MHDYDNKRYVTKNGYIKLSPFENIALGFMIANKGNIVIPSTYNKKININRLRDKLKNEVEIKLRWGIGYYIN